jgi:hypothetical protein
MLIGCDGAVHRRRRTERPSGGGGHFDRRERRKQIEIHDIRAWYNSDSIINGEEIVAGLLASASESQIFRKFVLPSAVPVIFNGLRLGLVFALLGVIGAEIFARHRG